MSRYIDADALVKDLKEELEIDSPMLNEVENKWVNKGIRIAIKDVKRFPTADVVEVVRCSECRYCEEAHYEEEGEKPYIKLKCKWSNYSHQPNDYCSYGERSENGKS